MGIWFLTRELSDFFEFSDFSPVVKDNFLDRLDFGIITEYVFGESDFGKTFLGLFLGSGL